MSPVDMQFSKVHKVPWDWSPGDDDDDDDDDDGDVHNYSDGNDSDVAAFRFLLTRNTKLQFWDSKDFYR